LPSISSFHPRHCDSLPLNVGGCGKLGCGLEVVWIHESLALVISGVVVVVVFGAGAAFAV
jgi:hypothetical protein